MVDWMTSSLENDGGSFSSDSSTPSLRGMASILHRHLAESSAGGDDASLYYHDMNNNNHDDYFNNNVTVPTFPSISNSGDNNSNDDSSNNHGPFMDERLGLIIFLVSTIASILLVLTMVVREYYFKKYGIDICPIFNSTSRQERERMILYHQQQNNGRNSSRRGNNHSTYEADRIFAEEIQRQLNEEEREKERQIKRLERRKWYIYFMRPYTMIVNDGDIFYAKEMEEHNDDSSANETTTNTETEEPDKENQDEQQQTEEDNKKVPRKSQIKVRRMSTADYSEEGMFTEDDDDEEIENAKNLQNDNDMNSMCPIFCDENDEEAHRYLELPPQYHQFKDDEDDANQELIGDSHRNRRRRRLRHVDGQCALCIDDYEVGDEVVWSDLECQHAFHKECILQWLSKGKKRCPMCRHWFVPGARIEDQKKLHGEAWEQAKAEIEREEQEQNNTINEDEMTKQGDKEPHDDDIPDIEAVTTEESEIDRSTSVHDSPRKEKRILTGGGAGCDESMMSRKSSETSEVNLQRLQEDSVTASFTNLAIDDDDNAMSNDSSSTTDQNVRYEEVLQSSEISNLESNDDNDHIV